MNNTQDKVREIKRLMEEVINETETKSNELVESGNINLSTLGRILKSTLTDYKTFLYNHWEHGDDKIILRLNQYDNKETLK